MNNTSTPVCRIKNLSVAIGRSNQTVVEAVNLSIAQGEFHAIVGESGSGKTMLARSVLGLLPPGGRVAQGEIQFDGQDIARLPAAALRKIRGNQIGMIFQDPLSSLNPALRIGQQMTEALRLHSGTDKATARDKAAKFLDRVGIPNPQRALDQYPHEFSGGMRQRIMIASTLLPGPRLLIADEPTTALDTIVQANVMEILKEVTAEFGVSVLFISHDLGLVAHRADTVTVMDKARVIEQGSFEEVLFNPQHDKTKALLAAVPQGTAKPENNTQREILLKVRDAVVEFRTWGKLPWQTAPATRALDHVSFDLHRGETLAIIGASGSGKTTLGRTILGLTPLNAGEIRLGDTVISGLKRTEHRQKTRGIQIVFQDPIGALDPRMRVLELVAESLRHSPDLSRKDKLRRSHQALEDCGLEAELHHRLPHQLSGGQRQRVAIARALVARPDIIVLDEPVSALDVTVQEQVLHLLDRLKTQHGLSYIFISHDIGVVEDIADRVIIMVDGKIVEQGSAHKVFNGPEHPFTHRLLSVLPELREVDGRFQLVYRNTDAQSKGEKIG
ncbi:dipeptide ABC transporter ATP-binding protein [Sulfitobacter pacificus]|uniref:Peptide ABC transporter ATP-binding protein n=1 Tax=Sulfitobacter pacificus TaxID=1499314 RepID=A0ABQ5VR28_9RHOB|nr:ABC transporter ATP-binding protein [Sulfitobacter pacificus]GLQ29409.1 peptide ABC transporter ATP-binding protein [Sulfitobacter pacificus]